MEVITEAGSSDSNTLDIPATRATVAMNETRDSRPDTKGSAVGLRLSEAAWLVALAAIFAAVFHRELGLAQDSEFFSEVPVLPEHVRIMVASASVALYVSWIAIFAFSDRGPRFALVGYLPCLVWPLMVLQADGRVELPDSRLVWGTWTAGWMAILLQRLAVSVHAERRLSRWKMSWILYRLRQAPLCGVLVSVAVVVLTWNPSYWLGYVLLFSACGVFLALFRNTGDVTADSKRTT